MPNMRAMFLDRPGQSLAMRERPVLQPGHGEILIEVKACGVCRTDLHVVDGELPNPKLPIVPGHEIVGRVAAIGAAVLGFAPGERVGIPWLGHTCGLCPYCHSGASHRFSRAARQYGQTPQVLPSQGIPTRSPIAKPATAS